MTDATTNAATFKKHFRAFKDAFHKYFDILHLFIDPVITVPFLEQSEILMAETWGRLMTVACFFNEKYGENRKNFAARTMFVIEEIRLSRDLRQDFDDALELFLSSLMGSFYHHPFALRGDQEAIDKLLDLFDGMLTGASRMASIRKIQREKALFCKVRFSKDFYSKKPGFA